MCGGGSGLVSSVGVCSDGVSRTGTFLTIHCQLERLKTEGVVDFLQAIKSARLHRPGLVNNTVSWTFIKCRIASIVVCNGVKERVV